MNKAIACCLLFLSLLSCKEKTLFHSYHPIDNMGWYRNDTLSYHLNSPLTTKDTANLYIGIRHKDTYRYRDIWLIVNDDTLHVHLADSSNHWNGKGLGELRQLTVPVTFNIPEGDSIQELRIVHIMRDNPLKGIHDIGIQIKGN